jgi:hypothetical protein
MENNERSGPINNNDNKVKVNNNFNLSIHFGDSLNLVALIGGYYLIKTIANQYMKKENRCKKYKNR